MKIHILTISHKFCQFWQNNGMIMQNSCTFKKISSARKVYILMISHTKCRILMILNVMLYLGGKNHAFKN